MLYFIQAFYSKNANSEYYRNFYFPLNASAMGWYIASYINHVNCYSYRNGRIQSEEDWVYL